MSLTKLKFIPLLALALSASLTLSPARAEDKKDGARTQQGGLLPGETREQKRERLVGGIEKQTGTLTADQKAHILAVLKAAGDEMAAARANKALTEEQQSAVVSKVHGEVFDRFIVALTPEQQVKLKASSDYRSNTNRGAGLRAGESFEQRRVRLLQNYEEVLPDLTVKQKSEIMAVNETASDEMGVIRANTTLSDEQRREAILKAHADVAKKVDVILTDSQRKTWNKNREEKRKQRQAANATAEKAEKTEKTAVAKY